MILVYNSTTQKWEPKPPEYVLSLVVSVMNGASETDDGSAGLVPTPMAGQQNLYLQGNGTWSDPTTDIKSELARLKSTDTNSTIRQIAADEVAKIINNAPDSLDTLGEIAEWIANHDDVIDIVEVTTDVTALNNAVFGPNGNDGLVNDVETLDVLVNGNGNDVPGLVNNVSILQSNYTLLNNKVTNVTGRVDTLETTVSDLDNKLKWQDLVYEND